MHNEELRVTRNDRGGAESWDVWCEEVRGRLATVTGFNTSAGAILLPAVSRHYWPAQHSRDDVLAAVLAARRHQPKEEAAVRWLSAWRAHVASGRAMPCAYETAQGVCNKPGVAGRTPIHCDRCDMGTLQNRFARRACAARADAGQTSAEFNPTISTSCETEAGGRR